jgi:hypothetical protein
MHIKIVRFIPHTSFRVSYVRYFLKYTAAKYFRPTTLKCIVGVEVVLHTF